MEIDFKGVDYAASKFDVQKAIQDVLHGPELYDPEDPKNKGRVPNFMLKMNMSTWGPEHDGTGVLILPRQLGDRFLEWFFNKNKIIVRGHKLRFYRSARKVSEEEKQILDNALYIGPEQEQTRWLILAHLQTRIRVARVQFGVWYRPESQHPGGKVMDRIFSVEYERDYTEKSAAYVEIVYDHKLMKLEVRTNILYASLYIRS
jgi:RNA-dependent RNA polymerase